MGKGNRTAREQAQRVIEEQRRRQVRKQGLIAAGGGVALVLLVLIVMVIMKVTAKDEKPVALPTGSAAVDVVATATTVPASVLDQVGKGKVDGMPIAVTDQPALTADGKPLVLYIGAEYCPFCASQRWAVVVALSRFGTFADLGVSHSASDDSYPNTQTLSFHGSKYTSQYLSFQGVETATNVRKGNSYEPLESLTPEQHQVMTTLNVARYVSKAAAGSIPFLDLGNKYVQVGSGFDPGLLKGRSAAQIATALHNPNDPIAKGADGVANVFTAAICKLTGGQPGDVCDSTAVRAFAGKV